MNTNNIIIYVYIYLEFCSMYNFWVRPKTFENPKTAARSKNHLVRNLCSGQLLKVRRTLQQIPSDYQVICYSNFPNVHQISPNFI